MPIPAHTLLIDSGNSWVKWRFRDAAGTLLRGSFAQSLPSPPAYPANAPLGSVNPRGLSGWTQLADLPSPPKQLLIAHVGASTLQPAMDEFAHTHWGITPQWIKASAEVPQLRNGYLEPTTLGVDRWLNMLAIRARCTSAFVIVSAGTAITLDVVDHTGEHLGGWIMPGLQAMQTQGQQRPAYVSWIAGISAFSAQSLGHNTPLYVTGGDAKAVLSQLPGLNVAAYEQPDCVLLGLEVLAENA